jgi:hypothetical protein
MLFPEKMEWIGVAIHGRSGHSKPGYNRPVIVDRIIANLVITDQV